MTEFDFSTVPQALQIVSGGIERLSRDNSSEYITFHSDTSYGTPLGAALRATPDGLVKSIGLKDPKEVLTVHTKAGSKVSYIINMHEHGRPFVKQKYARSIKGGKPTPVNRAKLVTQLAEVVEAFIHDRCTRMDVPYPFRVGNGGIELHHLYLVALRRVTYASWELILAVDRRYTPSCIPRPEPPLIPTVSGSSFQAVNMKGPMPPYTDTEVSQPRLHDYTASEYSFNQKFLSRL